VNQFLSGVLFASYLVAALFFLRFWRRTRDRFFLFFTAAFALLALQRGLLSFRVPHAWLDLLFYGVRAFAFLVLIAGILDKNRRAG
jgi:hypothetical protein